MKLKSVSTEGLLECVKCGNHFYFPDAGIRHTYLYGKQITIRCCPYCNSQEIEMVRDQKRLEKFRYFEIKDRERIYLHKGRI